VVTWGGIQGIPIPFINIYNFSNPLTIMKIYIKKLGIVDYFTYLCTMAFYKLSKNIIELSNSTAWDEAIVEWI